MNVVQIVWKNRLAIVGVMTWSSVFILPSVLADGGADPETPIVNLRGGSVLKFKSARGSVPYGVTGEDGEFPKIVIAGEVSAKDLTESRVNEFVGECYTSEKRSQVSALVLSSISRVHSRDQRPGIKVYSWSADVGKNETGAAEALYKLIQSDMPMNWPFDGRVEDDVESYRIDQDCLKKSFAKLYDKLSKLEPRCEMRFDVSVAKSKNFDPKSFQEITVKDPVENKNGWVDFAVSKPKALRSFGCPGTLKTIGDLGALIDGKGSWLKIGKPADPTANVTLEKSEDGSISSAVNTNSRVKTLPSENSGTSIAKPIESDGVESDSVE